MRHQNGEVVTIGVSVSVCVGAKEELKASSTRSTHCTTEPCPGSFRILDMLHFNRAARGKISSLGKQAKKLLYFVLLK